MTETKIHEIKFQHSEISDATMNFRFLDPGVRDKCISILKEKGFDVTGWCEWTPFTSESLAEVAEWCDEEIKEATEFEELDAAEATRPEDY